MLIAPVAVEALLDAGVHVAPAASDRVVFHTAVAGRRHSVEAVVVSRARTVGPNALAQLEPVARNDRVLVVAPAVSDASREFLDARGWSWIAVPTDGRSVRGAIHFPDGETVRIGPQDPSSAGDLSQPGLAVKRGRKPWGRTAVVRHLLRGGAWSQTDLARRSGVSQPRVSQVLAELQRQGLVGRITTSDGRTRWQTGNYDRLMQHWLDTYPGPAGVTTYWYHLDSIRHQTAIAVEALRRASTVATHGSDAGNPVVSGDAAADYLAPYRRSVFAVVYCAWGGDLEAAGFIPAAPASATLRLVIPEDRSMWPQTGDHSDSHAGEDLGEGVRDDMTARLAPGAPYPIADPLQVIWDLAHGPGPDADQAAGALKSAVLDYALQRQARGHG